jgi:hypothetical protein
VTKSDSVKLTDNGGPSEDRGFIRIGQLDWVPIITKAEEFSSWYFKYKTGAAVYLHKDLFSNADRRKAFYLVAVLKGPSLGNFEEMCRLIELYDNEGTECEELLERLKEKFLPAIEIEKKKATQVFMSFARGKQSLSVAVKQLKLILLECNKQGYNPDSDTIVAKYESILLPQEMPLYRLYFQNIKAENAQNGSRSSSSSTLNAKAEAEQRIRAIETLGKDQEGIKDPTNEGTQPYAGIARGNKSNNGPRRLGFNHEYKKSIGNQDNGKQNKCNKCGKQCPATKGQGKDKCYAYGKECRKCHKKGHFESVCLSKKSHSKADAATSGQKEVALAGF